MRAYDSDIEAKFSDRRRWNASEIEAFAHDGVAQLEFPTPGVTGKRTDFRVSLLPFPKALLSASHSLSFHSCSLPRDSRRRAPNSLPAAPHAREIHLKHVLLISQTKASSMILFPLRWRPLQHGAGVRLVGHHAPHDTELLTKKD